ncbi:MAG: hypothetical protein QXI12_12305 [Candidatus Methanomethyliaceae archaeon]
MFQRNADDDYGCTLWKGVSDMTAKHGTLLEQLEQRGIPYKVKHLAMGTLFAEPAYLVHYTSASNVPMTVLVVPAVVGDGWNEDYFYFPYLEEEEAAKLDWYEVQRHVRAVALETAARATRHPTPCSVCGKLNVFASDSYKDLRGRERCAYCHHLRDTK